MFEFTRVAVTVFASAGPLPKGLNSIVMRMGPIDDDGAGTLAAAGGDGALLFPKMPAVSDGADAGTVVTAARTGPAARPLSGGV